MDSAFTKTVSNELVQTTVAYCKYFCVGDDDFNKLKLVGILTINIKVDIPLPLPSAPAKIIGDQISEYNYTLFQQPGTSHHLVECDLKMTS